MDPKMLGHSATIFIVKMPVHTATILGLQFSVLTICCTTMRPRSNFVGLTFEGAMLLHAPAEVV